jgi:hypothetical protein
VQASPSYANRVRSNLAQCWGNVLHEQAHGGHRTSLCRPPPWRSGQSGVPWRGPEHALHSPGRLSVAPVVVTQADPPSNEIYKNSTHIPWVRWGLARRVGAATNGVDLMVAIALDGAVAQLQMDGYGARYAAQRRSRHPLAACQHTRKPDRQQVTQTTVQEEDARLPGRGRH